MSRVLEFDEVLGSKGLAAAEAVRYSYPAYTSSGTSLPARHRLPPPQRRAAGVLPGPRSARANSAPIAIKAELVPRADVQRNVRKSQRRTAGSAKSRPGDPEYARGTFAVEGRPRLPGVAPLLNNPELCDLARAYHDAKITVPFLIYANVWLPGQLLSVHTDIPAFRGATALDAPPWLLVVMRHSGLFERWRVPIATAVCYFEQCRGGELTYFDDSSGKLTPVTVTPRPNSAVMFDGDTVFHQVEPIAGGTAVAGRLTDGAYLRPGRRRWEMCVDDGYADVSVASYLPEEMRYSLSWKAFCFPDDDAYRAWVERRDDIDRGSIVATLVEELCRRGTLERPEHGLSDRKLAELFIDEFIAFPKPAKAAAVPRQSR